MEGRIGSCRPVCCTYPDHVPSEVWIARTRSASLACCRSLAVWILPCYPWQETMHFAGMRASGKLTLMGNNSPDATPDSGPHLPGGLLEMTRFHTTRGCCSSASLVVQPLVDEFQDADKGLSQRTSPPRFGRICRPGGYLFCRWRCQIML